jgi:hypothetical protein
VTTLTLKQKALAYAAFKRGWRKAMGVAGKQPMTPTEKALLLQASVREAIFNLPEKQSLWGRIRGGWK